MKYIQAIARKVLVCSNCQMLTVGTKVGTILCLHLKWKPETNTEYIFVKIA